MGSRGSGSKGKGASGGTAPASPPPPSGIDAFAALLNHDAENALAAEARSYILQTEDAAFAAMTVAERNIMKSYSGDAYTAINRHARYLAMGILKPGDKPLMDKKVQNLTNALNKAVTDRQMVVYRGLRVPELEKAFDSGNIVGTRIHNHSFNSTSSQRSTAESFGHGGIIMKMVLPKGYRGAAPLYKNSKHSNESEILINKNRAFKVVKAETVNGKRYVVVTPDD